MAGLEAANLVTYQTLDQELQQIRLITILPGSRGDDVHCTMEVVSLLQEPLPDYETVSYVWGNADLRSFVYVNERKLDIPASAEIVLRRIRNHGVGRRVWIDSLCIDQSSLSDRNEQVRLMCKIYSQGAMNLICLGDGHGNGEVLHSAFSALYDEARRETSDFKLFKDMVWPGWWDPYHPPSAVRYDAEQMARFFDLPWFSRLWYGLVHTEPLEKAIGLTLIYRVVQEAALASHSVCYYDSLSIPLLLIQRVAIWLYSKSKSTDGPLTGHAGLARAVHLASYTDELFEAPFRGENNLLWMLNTLKQYDTSRDEDHVYGLAGIYQQFLLHGDVLPERLLPDYKNSLALIFGNATKYAIDELRRLDPLLYVCHRTPNELEHSTLPTWVPKWHRQQDLRVDHFPLNYSQFKASGACERALEAGPSHDGTLTVKGFILAPVQRLSSSFSQKVLLEADALHGLLQSAELLIEQSSPDAGGLRHTLVASLDHRMSL